MCYYGARSRLHRAYKCLPRGKSMAGKGDEKPWADCYCSLCNGPQSPDEKCLPSAQTHSESRKVKTESTSEQTDCADLRPAWSSQTRGTQTDPEIRTIVIGHI